MLGNTLIPDLPCRIDVEPTINCNLACIMCQRTYWKRKSPDMKFAAFTQIYDSFPKIEKIKIQGVGEPLLNPDIYEMIRFSKEHGSHVTTYTNGSLFHLRDNAARLLGSGIDLIKISIDGGSKETYEKIRINGDFEQLISNILLISKLRKGATPRVELWMVGLPHNLHEIRKVIDICAMAEIDTLHVQIILNTYDYSQSVGKRLSSLLLQDYQPAASYLQQAQIYADKKMITLKLFAVKTYSLRNPCNRPFHSLFVSVEGDIVPCSTISDPNVITMGNIFKEDIRDIWASVNYQRFRLSLLEGKLSRPCQNCYRESNKLLISQLNE
jgi:pyrroloquinoline quinone biosynthesis protein E